MTETSIVRASLDDLDAIMPVMRESFDPRFGEAWTREQCLGLLTMPGSVMFVASDEAVAGFALSRMLAGEAELMLLAVHPTRRRKGIGRLLLEAVSADANAAAMQSIYLEVRAGNPAAKLYSNFGFAHVGTRARYYRGNSGETFDALTFRLKLS